MFCKNCGENIKEDIKFCGKCGGSVKITNTSQLDVEKLKKSIKNTGNSVFAIGWLTIIINVILYIWSIVDENFFDTGLPVSDFSGLFLIVVLSSIFIILGNRIRELIDKNIKFYLQVLLGLSVLFFIWIILSGGRVGILFFLVIIYLISSLFIIRKLIKIEEFASTLTRPKYILNKEGWTAFIVIAFLVFFFATPHLDSVIREIISGERLTNSEKIINDNKQVLVKFETNLGNIEIELYPNKAPKTVENFVKLAEYGFYDDTKFHRVIKGFMIQGGDPFTKDENSSIYGTGGPGYKFADEINDLPMVRGMIAMANSGPDTNGSQFFIITAEETPWLIGNHTVFGKVIFGMDVVDIIEKTKTGANDLPLVPVFIKRVIIN